VLSRLVATRKPASYAHIKRSRRKLRWTLVAILTCKSFVTCVYRGERPIELASSWFPPNFPSGKLLLSKVVLPCRDNDKSYLGTSFLGLLSNFQWGRNSHFTQGEQPDDPIRELNIFLSIFSVCFAF